ncbi:MAG: M20 family metallopeptidase [Bacilli bacterium]|jgi:acetylornithine deacetylase|nr:M20 family metallopeptidase [Bacilli bacterium]MCX4254997.1 M20/M25/M40 family metallo-hydrolase [Bacilli bacterium]
MKIENILRDLVSFKTINDLENLKIINYLESFLKNLGFKTEYKTKCLVMSIGNDPILSFIGHTDTVACSTAWQTNPFKLTIKGDKLIGLGSSDMKGGIAAFLYVLQGLDLKSLVRGIRVCFTYDEETEFRGIKELINAKTNFGEYSIIGEPTDNYPCIGSKGLLEYELIFRGTSVHSSTPISNESSNENAIMFLNEVLKLNSKFQKEQNNLFEVPYNTINIGTINGGINICTTSDYTKVLLGFRITKNYQDIKYIKKYIEKLTNKYPKVEARILNEIKPFYNENTIIADYEAITKRNSRPFFGVSEASFLNNNRLILGPGPITAHEVNEYISKTSLIKTVDIYQKIIERICY